MHVEEYKCDINHYSNLLYQMGQGMAKQYAGNTPDTDLEELTSEFIDVFDDTRGPVETRDPATLVNQSAVETVRTHFRSTLNEDTLELLDTHALETSWLKEEGGSKAEMWTFLEQVFDDAYIRSEPLESTSFDEPDEQRCKRCSDCGGLEHRDATYCGSCGVHIESSDQIAEWVSLPPYEGPSLFYYCPSCGAGVSEDHSFCISCSDEIPESGASSAACLWCGHEINQDDNYCFSCGESTDTDSIVCTDCGTRVPKQIDFCRECRAPIAIELHSCPECNHEQRSGRPICMECGVVIDPDNCIACPNCDDTVPADAAQCSTCMYDFETESEQAVSVPELVDYMLQELDDTVVCRVAEISQYGHCDFQMPTSAKGGYMYVEDEDGERIECRHPGEQFTVQNILGEDASRELIEERTGFNSYCVCLECLAQFDADLDRGERQCPECGSNYVRSEVELTGGECPSCTDGIIITNWTGSIV